MSALLFGLDGATYHVLDHLVREGVMPYLGRFMAGGARATLMSTVPPLTPIAWSTLVTGRSAGHHGIVGFFQHDSAASSSLGIVSGRQLRCETIWSIVNRSGVRAGSLNFVAHHPAPRIDGYVMPGWVPRRWIKRFSHPPDLVDRLQQAIPGFSLRELAMDFDQERKSIDGTSREDYETWIDLHIRRDRQWFEVLRHQLRADPCGLVGVVFDGVDKLQHLFWPYLDPGLETVAHGGGNGNANGNGNGNGNGGGNGGASSSDDRLRSCCREYFRHLDRFLEETVDACGPDTHVFIVSDHGFTGTGHILYINTWLEQQGHLAWKPDTEYVTEDSQELEPDFYRLAAFDLSKTRAYALTAGNNGIHIVVQGQRGEHGIAREDYARFSAELIDALLTRCVDPDTGERLVAQVATREEAFAGPHMGLAPDLILTLRDHGFVSVRRSRAIVARRPRVVGTHHPEGVFIARGPGIRAGARMPPVQLVDVAPTLLYALGLPIPSDFEGRPLVELFTPGRVGAAPPTTSDATRPVPVPAPAEPEDVSDILASMRALGYIE